MVTLDEKQAFSNRLNAILDVENVPPKGSGRQNALAKEWGLSQKGVRKWLEGEAIPETSRLIEIAKRYQVSFEWLATGRDPVTLEPCKEIVRGSHIRSPSAPVDFTESATAQILSWLNGRDAATVTQIVDALGVLLKGSEASTTRGSAEGKARAVRGMTKAAHDELTRRPSAKN